MPWVTTNEWYIDTAGSIIPPISLYPYFRPRYLSWIFLPHLVRSFSILFLLLNLNMLQSERIQFRSTLYIHYVTCLWGCRRSGPVPWTPKNFEPPIVQSLSVAEPCGAVGVLQLWDNPRPRGTSGHVIPAMASEFFISSTRHCSQSRRNTYQLSGGALEVVT